MRTLDRFGLPPGDLVLGLQLLRGLPGFLRHPVRPAEARAALATRLTQREATFLALMRRAVFASSVSAYQALLRHAGCAYDDLVRLVTADGVEGALGALARAGVYLTGDELKGRRPVVRGALRFTVTPAAIRNPSARPVVPLQSSGSRGPRRRGGIDLRFMRDVNVNLALVLEARGARDWQHGIWGVPGGAELTRLLRYGGVGAMPVRWFTQLADTAPDLPQSYRWGPRVLRWAGRLAGVVPPRPVHVPREAPLPIARWMADVLGRGGTPHLATFASNAVRLCEAAETGGIDLRGAQFTLGGEPLTATRLAALHRNGARALPQYGSSETGAIIAYGCLEPDAADDLHLCHDLCAVVAAGTAPALDLPPPALLLTALRPLAPLVLLNASLGDQAIMDQRACGCALERLGWTTHLRSVRSFEKLTAGGMTFFDVDVVRVLEGVLPARFGGGPTDYQLVEDETDAGQPRLRLLVNPGLGPLDEGAVVTSFLDALAPDGRASRVMGLAWRDAGFLRVERRAVQATPGGKILHLHTARHASERAGAPGVLDAGDRGDP